MTTKLTLSLNNHVISKAKDYAKKNHTSLSVLVENYFRFLTERTVKEPKSISPIIEELSGIIDLPEDFDINENYTDYLTEKYKS